MNRKQKLSQLLTVIAGAYYFLLCWIILIVIYAPAYKAGFEGDFAGWLHVFKSDSFLEIIHRKHFRVQSLYQLTMAELWGLTHLFGKAPLPWFLLHTCLHALNATLLLQFLRKFYQALKWQGGSLIALLSATLFLLAYTHAEPVIWKGAFHYLTGVMMILLVLTNALGYLLTASRKHQLWAIIVFAFSCFSLEIFYLTPLLVLAIYLLLYWGSLVSYQQLTTAIKNLWLPLLLCFVLYYLLYLATYQKAIAHYNIKSHAWSVGYLLPKYRLYPMRILFFEGEGFLSTKFYRVFGYAFFASLMVMSLLLMWRVKRLNAKWRAALFLCCGIVLSIGVVTPLGYNIAFQIRNGHYAYLITLFLLPLVALGLSMMLKNTKVLLASIAFYAMLHMAFAAKAVATYRDAQKVFEQLLFTFPDKTSTRHKIILAMPATYKGIVQIGADTTDRFAQLYNTFYSPAIKGTFYSLAAYEMASSNWDVWVKRIAPFSWEVQLPDTANRWKYRYFEPFDFESVIYKIEFSDARNAYTLTLKDTTRQYDLYTFKNGAWHYEGHTRNTMSISR